jgi:hypothetical protein
MHPKATRFALISLAISVLGLIMYAIVISGAAFMPFAVSTGCASVAGIVSLALGMMALSLSRQREASSSGLRLAMVSLSVAIGYVLVMGILWLNVFIYVWRSR